MLATAGWRAIFWLLVVVGIATLAVLPTLHETLPVARRDGRPLANALTGYAALLRDRRLFAYAGAGGFFYAGMFAYIAGSPYAYIVVHHVPPQAYGLLFATGFAGIMGANLLSAKFVHRLGSDRLLVWGAVIAAGSGAIPAVDVGFDRGGLAGLVGTS
jgi:DHA1 family bicyclomycin/chloramphenicol resistance-like MFS transporter